MAITGITAFNPDVGEIVEEAYERTGVILRDGYQLRSAKRSLNLLMLEWANRGINLWKFEDAIWDSVGDGSGTTTLTKGVAEYSLPIGTISVYDVSIRERSGTSNQNDFMLSRISAPTYLSIPNKLSEGKPLQYLVKRHEVQDISASTDRNTSLTLWPVPDANNKYELIYWKMARMSDVGSSVDSTMEVPDRFIPALISGLAFNLALKNPDPAISAKAQQLKLLYEEDYIRAANEDRDKSDIRIVPFTFNV